MPLVNVKKKVEKAGAKAGLEPGELVLAGCTTNPSGTVTRMMARELSGVVGAAVLGDRNGEDQSVAGGLADRFVPGQNFVVVTDRRVLLIAMSTLTGKPKELLAAWDRAEVTAIEVGRGKLALPFTIRFTDCSAVQVEGAKGSDPRSVQTAFDTGS